MKKFPFSLLIVKELYTFCKRVLSIVTVPLTENTYVQSLRSSILPALANLEKALGKSLTSEFTSVIIAKDKIRDNVFIGLRNYISSFTRSQIPAKASAALFLWQILEDVGLTIYRHSYTIETAEINSLVSRLKEPAATAAMTTLNATEWLDQLIVAQDDFEATYKDKVETEALIDLPLANESAGIIIQYLDSLLNYIDGNSQYEAVTFGPLKAQIEEVIIDVLAQARMRITIAAKNRDDEQNTAS